MVRTRVVPWYHGMVRTMVPNGTHVRTVPWYLYTYTMVLEYHYGPLCMVPYHFGHFGTAAASFRRHNSQLGWYTIGMAILYHLVLPWYQW